MARQKPLSPRGWEGDVPEVASPETGLVRQSGTVAQGGLPDHAHRVHFCLLGNSVDFPLCCNLRAAGTRNQGNCMKSFPIVAAALSAAVPPGFAAESVILAAALPPVVVTATRFPDIQRQFPVGVTVITEEDIRNSTASTVPELLRMLPGVQTRDLSGSPNLQMDLRGFGIFGDQNTLVLLDGQRISENEQLTVNWSSIPLDAIERIEVMRGSGSVLYGAGATGGTINIITKAPMANTRSGFVEGGVGSYRTRDVRIGANIAGERTGLRLTMAHRESDGYRDNNALR
jgi:iron complex outermembrane receptor protein